MLNRDMLDAMAGIKGRQRTHDGHRPNITDRAPGKGTVIYLTIPVYEDGAAAERRHFD
jgi:hypothetical protein